MSRDEPGALVLLRQTPAALVVGVGCALSLIVVSALAERLQDLVWDDLAQALGADSGGAVWIICALTGAGLLAGLIVWLAPGHAGPDPATSGLVAAPVRLGYVPGLAAAVVVTLAGGISLGPENPIMLINASLVVALAGRAFPGVTAPTWVGLSMSATVGAMFGTPVAAALMLSEVNPGDPRVPLWSRLFGPLVAAGAGSATMLALTDSDLSIAVPAYPGFRVGDLAVAAVIALVATVVGLVACYAITPMHALWHRIGHPVVLFTLSGLCLGVIGTIGGPESLFKGLDEMKDISSNIGDYGTGSLLLIAGAKLLAVVVAAGSSWRGGRIFPALFIGVVLGWAVSDLFDGIPPALAISAAALGILIAISRNGWLALFMALTAVPDLTLLPILLLAALPCWLLVLGRPEMTVTATGSPGSDEVLPDRPS